MESEVIVRKKRVYVKPETVRHGLKTSVFIALSTRPIPNLPADPDPEDVLDVVDCCMRINGYTPGEETQNTDSILNSLLNTCHNKHVDGECGGVCWMPSNTQSFKIIKTATGYSYTPYTGRNCTDSSNSSGNKDH